MNDIQTLPYLRKIRIMLCGAIFILFALSHIGFLRISGAEGALPSVVFPFMSMNLLIAVAAIVEGAVGIYCLFFSGSTRARQMVVLLLVTLVWYRFTYNHFSENRECNCLGLVARLLNLKEPLASRIPVFIIGALAILACEPERLIFLRRRVPATAAMVVFGLMLLAPQPMRAGELIQGTVTANVFNPSTGKEYEDMAARSTFEVRREGDTFAIVVQSMDSPEWKYSFFYDGKRSLLLLPAAGGGYYRGEVPKSDRQLALVSADPVPYHGDMDALGLSCVWIAYALGPQVAAGRIGETAQLPLIWSSARRSLSYYGYEWKINLNGASVATMSAVRNKALDMDIVEETNRPGLELGETIAQQNRMKMQLMDRQSRTDGFIVAAFKTLEEGVDRLPRRAELTVQLGQSQDHKYHWRRYAVELKESRSVTGERISLPPMQRGTTVKDFTFAARSAKMSFKFARYDLDSNEVLKAPDDPDLLAERSDHLNGRGLFRGYTRLAYWLALPLALGLSLVAFRRLA